MNELTLQDKLFNKRLADSFNYYFFKIKSSLGFSSISLINKVFLSDITKAILLALLLINEVGGSAGF